MTGIVYIHVPKCGGSSFGAALRLRYLYSQATINLGHTNAAVNRLFPHATGEARIVADYCQRGTELANLMARGVQCVSGHVRDDGELHSKMNGYAFVTLLRDPIERFVSHYHYLQRRHPDPARPDRLGAFLDTRDAARLASQYLFYFSGHSQNHTDDLNRSVARAQSALARFDLVGDLGDPLGFARALGRLTGGVLPWLHRNRAPVPTRVPPELRAHITELCAPDLAIYQAAKARIAA